MQRHFCHGFSSKILGQVNRAGRDGQHMLSTCNKK
jgi:hypothetical protein